MTGCTRNNICLADNTGGAKYADYAYHHPKYIEHGISAIFFQQGAPR